MSVYVVGCITRKRNDTMGNNVTMENNDTRLYQQGL